jgi:hypothetical protein
MSYYQRSCEKDPQPIEFNNIDVKHTVAFRKETNPYIYKYKCGGPVSHKFVITKRNGKRTIETFDFNTPYTVDYAPKPCIYTVSGSYLCLK